MRCETPKSPPGDYNPAVAARNYTVRARVRVKHLNPRQGITTVQRARAVPQASVGCETPKSPPGDYNAADAYVAAATELISVKHLNPRQGITTYFRAIASASTSLSVKHLNPRQGITTSFAGCSMRSIATWRCETPKSPPGDYNAVWEIDDLLLVRDVV